MLSVYEEHASQISNSGGIVWLASFPKSGNTWFRLLLANLAAGDKGPVDINDIEERGGIASSRHEFEAVTLLDSGLLRHDEIDVLRPRVYERIAAEASERERWIKVHDAYTYTTQGEPLLGGRAVRAAIYLVRDPRDVAVSWSHHSNVSIDQAVAQLNATDMMLSTGRKSFATQLRQKLLGWSGHAASWLDQKDVPVFLLRYEDLLADTERYFAKALTFAGRRTEKENIARAVNYASFEELKRQEGEKGFAERMARNAPFFRSGKKDGWREVLNAEQAGAIVNCHADMMTRLGYEF